MHGTKSTYASLVDAEKRKIDTLKEDFKNCIVYNLPFPTILLSGESEKHLQGIAQELGDSFGLKCIYTSEPYSASLSLADALTSSDTLFDGGTSIIIMDQREYIFGEKVASPYKAREILAKFLAFLETTDRTHPVTGGNQCLVLLMVGIHCCDVRFSKHLNREILDHIDIDLFSAKKE